MNAFVAPGRTRGNVAMRAEGEAAPKESVALVKVTEESKITTASLLGGVAGFLVGGVWVGAGLFAAGAYLARKPDDDVSKALKGVAASGLEVVNFTSYLNDKYTVTDRLGSAITDAVGGLKGKSEAGDNVTSFLDGIGDAVRDADKDINFKGTLGNLAVSASDLANQAVQKGIDLNDKYRVTDQIKEKIEEVTNKSKTTTSN